MEQQTNQNYISSDEHVYMPSSDERTMAILAHLLTFVSSILSPLIIYLIKKDESKYVAQHAKEALNFQITAILVSILLTITVVGILLLWLVGLGVFICVIVATVKASENKMFRYPLSIRFIK
ncbi:MAG: DUF4870 domain-containing protein [Chitinophagaceae bacterium]